MTTIAQEWQEYYASCDKGVAPEFNNRLAFYAGWYACLDALARMKTDTTAGMQIAADEVLGWKAEFKEFSLHYLHEAQARMQREE